jgi:hypothetical protein
MIDRSLVRRLLLGAATGLALAVTGVSVPILAGSLTPAMAQSSDDMAAALDAYGHWVRHASYGEVWVPDGVPPDWRPYAYGHWVFTDDWGWYWVSDENEDDWGWVVYHYGRWAFDRAIGWFWVPGDEWAPAWVDWRYGGDNVGWAPLPPDDLIDAYDEQPDYWEFVPLRYIGEPGLRSHFLPRERRVFVLRETRIVNRPVHIEGRRLWVNPGLAPGFITGRTHVSLHAYQVRPRVFGATTSVQGALTVRTQDLRIKGAVRREAPITVQRSVTAIPTVSAPAPQPLGKGEHGQLGSHPPRAAQGTAAPQQQQQQGPAGTPPRTGPPVVQHPGPAPAVTPAAPPKVPERVEERRDVHPPAGAGGPPAGANGPPPRPAGPAPQPQTVHPVSPPPPPPPQHQPPPPVVHAPPPPPPPVVHTPPPPPPPPAVRAPPPPPPAARPAPPPAAQQKAPPPKPGEKPPEPPK